MSWNIFVYNLECDFYLLISGNLQKNLMDVVIKLIRSLTISSSDGLLIEDIDKLYKEDVGESVPFRKFGYDSLVEFLKSSGQFVPKRTQYGTKVMAKTTDVSAHIVEMRKNQTVSKTERKRKNRAAKSSKLKVGVIRPEPKSNASKIISRRKPKKWGSKQSEFPKDVREISAKPAFSTFNLIECTKHNVEGAHKMPIVSTKDVAAHSAKATSNSKSKTKTNLYTRLALKQPFEESKEINSSQSVFDTTNSIIGKTQTNGYPKRRGLHVRFEIQQPFQTQEFATRFESQDDKPALVPTPLHVPPSTSVQDKQTKLDLHARLSPKILQFEKTNKLNGPTSSKHTSPRAPPTTPVLNNETEFDLHASLCSKLYKQAENSNQLNEPTYLNSLSTARAAFLKRIQKQKQQSTENSKKCEKPCSNSSDMVQKITEAKKEQRSQLSLRLQARRTNLNSEMELITQKVIITCIELICLVEVLNFNITLVNGQR